MEVLITGGSGFIGSKTGEKLKERGYQVRLFKGDIRRGRDWETNLRGEETVLHLAAVRTETKTDFEINTRGTENLFKAVNKNGKIPRKMILVSSQAVYLGCKPPFKETARPKPTTIYGKSKLKAERISQKWCKKLKIPLIVLRYSTVLGSGIRKKSRMSGPLYIWVEAGLKSKPIKVYQDGNQSRDYVHVDDVATANLLAIESLDEGIYNVGSSEEVKLIDLANWVKKATGNLSEVLIVGGQPSPSDPRHLFSDTKKIKQFGWSTKKTAKKAVYEFVKSFKK